MAGSHGRQTGVLSRGTAVETKGILASGSVVPRATGVVDGTSGWSFR